MTGRPPRTRMGTVHSQNLEPRTCGRGDASGVPSIDSSIRNQKSNNCGQELTVSMESFATAIMMSTVELNGKWRVVFAFHPSDAFP